ncbi:hypothetical protein [Kibdelosporangium philippinense]
MPVTQLVRTSPDAASWGMSRGHPADPWLVARRGDRTCATRTLLVRTPAP